MECILSTKVLTKLEVRGCVGVCQPGRAACQEGACVLLLSPVAFAGLKLKLNVFPG